MNEVAASLAALVAAARACGVATEPILATAGLVDLHPEAWLPIEQVQRAWHGLLAAAGDDTLHLQAARHLSLGAFPHLDAIAASCSTVGDALTAVARYTGLVNGAFHFRVQAVGGEHHIRAVHKAGNDADFAFALMVLHASECLGRPARPRALFLRRPPYRRLATVLELFGEVYFEQPEDTLVFPAATWRLANPRADGGRRARMVADAERHLGARSFVEQVSLEIEYALPAAAADADTVAERLHLSRRTLQRRLQAAGTSFRAVLEDTRERLALQALHREVRVPDLAFRLGYADETALMRAFRRWTGSSVGRWKREIPSRINEFA